MPLLETLARSKPAKLPGRRTPRRSTTWHLPLRDRRAVLQRTLARLPERKRLVVALRHYEGLTLQEMAQALALDVEAVRALLDEAVAQLARALIQADRRARESSGTRGRQAA